MYQYFRPYTLHSLIILIVISSFIGADSATGAESLPIGQPGVVKGHKTTDNDIEERLKQLEHQVVVLSDEVGTNRTVYNIAKEAKALASDAWNVAVEARSIAVRAEGKADQLQQDQQQ